MFKETRTFDQGERKHIHYQTAICSACGAFENHPVKSRALPPEPLVKLFQRRGWVMGTSRNHDICPACVKDAAKAKKEKLGMKRNKFLNGTAQQSPGPGVTPLISIRPTTAEVIDMASALFPHGREIATKMLKPIESALAPASQTPRQPTREDKRLIILEIENHYLGPDKGYTSGSTDESVAKGLNVPVKWVADLREEFFGPLVNPEIGKLNGEVASLLTRLDAHEREGREIRTKLNDIKERLAKAGGGR
jgi:hypothetical protein